MISGRAWISPVTATARGPTVRSGAFTICDARPPLIAADCSQCPVKPPQELTWIIVIGPRGAMLAMHWGAFPVLS